MSFTGTQLLGAVQTSKGTSDAMLCIDSDRPNEYLIQLWGTELECAALFLAEKMPDGQLNLKVQRYFRVGDLGGLWAPNVLTDEEKAFLMGLSVSMKEVDGAFSGEWRGNGGESGKVYFAVRPSPPGLAATECRTWEDFKKWATQVRNGENVSAFRGHGSNLFRLRTTLQRAGRNRLERYNTEVLPEFCRHAEAVLNGKFSLLDGDDYSVVLGLAQHHGLPTPLLDWTGSPYIAAFFAFSDAFENLAARPEVLHVRIYGLTDSFLAAHWSHRVTLAYKRPYVSPIKISPRLNPRLYAQQGQFLVTNMADVEQYVREFDEKHGTTSLIAADVPIDCCEEALRDLNFMGLNAANLFPGLDGVGKMLKHAMAFSGFRAASATETPGNEQRLK
jgi:hypothetical protein